MVKRIEWILSTKNLTPAQLADSIGIQRSSLSHILARRNKPSLDVVMKILHRYPDLETDWLLTGKGPMYKDGTRPSPSDVLMPDNDSAAPAFAPPAAPPAAPPSTPSAMPPSAPPVTHPAATVSPSPSSGALDLFSDETPFTYTRLAPSEKRDPWPSTAPQGPEWPPRTAPLSEIERALSQRDNAFAPMENPFPGIDKALSRENENPPLFSRRDKTEDDQKEIKEIERIVFFFSDGSFRVYES